MKYFFILLLLVSCSSGKLKKNEEFKAFRVGHLFDSQNGTWLKNQFVLVREGKIVELNPHSLPEETQIVDLGDNYIIPGLIDAHSHLLLDDPTYSRDFSEGLLQFYTSKSDQRHTMGLTRAKTLLASGFTTIRDLGNQGEINPKTFRSWPIHSVPRIFSSGPGFVPEFGQFPPGTRDSTVFTEYALLKKSPEGAFERHLKAGVDLMKLYADEEPNHSYADLEVLKRWVQYAHAHNLKVAIHAVLPKGISLAIKSGADTLEHGSFINQKQLKEMAQKKMILVPANSFSLFLLPELKEYKVHDTVETVQRNCKNIKSAHAEGVPVAFGSDNYFSLEEKGMTFGETTMQILLDYADCGISPVEILKAATYNGAKALGQEKNLGRLIPGAHADFIVLKKDPLRELSTLKDLKAVYKSGILVEED